MASRESDITLSLLKLAAGHFVRLSIHRFDLPTLSDASMARCRAR